MKHTSYSWLCRFLLATLLPHVDLEILLECLQTADQSCKQCCEVYSWKLHNWAYFHQNQCIWTFDLILEIIIAHLFVLPVFHIYLMCDNLSNSRHYHCSGSCFMKQSSNKNWCKYIFYCQLFNSNVCCHLWHMSIVKTTNNIFNFVIVLSR